MSQFTNKTVVVTGGTDGIGRALVLNFLELGANVVTCGRSQQKILALEAEAPMGKVCVLNADVSAEKDCERLVDHAIKMFGGIDILINSAGMNATKRNLDILTTESWDEVVNINLNGLFYCVHSVLPTMRAQGDGLIINVSSWAGLYASKLTGPAYNATKRAVLALSESINMEECASGIRASSLLPGEVATPILNKRPVPPSQEVRERMVQAEDMGKAILFLAQMPARTCINELIISPTYNRFYLGGLETPPEAKSSNSFLIDSF